MPNSLVRNALAAANAKNGNDAPATAPEQPSPNAAPQQPGYQNPVQQAMQPASDMYQQAQVQAQFQQQFMQAPQPNISASSVDEELLKIAAQLDVCIKIMGCGGGGSNTINRCIDAGINGAQLCAINTDAKHLLTVHSPNKILIGRNRTRGLGAGAIPEVGEAAARENDMEIRHFLQGSNIVFVTAGMGGGTGTGSAHYVARIAKEQLGCLTLGVVTLPFEAEGNVRMENALEGLDKMRRICDTTIVIPNDKILDLVPNLPVDQAFKVADEVLMQTIKGLTEIITKPGLVNLDYADLQTVMKAGGVAFVGIGEAAETSGKRDRIEVAVEEALSSPLLGEIQLEDAKGALIRVVGGPDMTVSEAERAAKIVSSRVSDRARIIWGCSVDPELVGQVRILLIVTGAHSKYMLGAADDMGAPVRPSMAGYQVGGPSYDDDTGLDFIR